MRTDGPEWPLSIRTGKQWWPLNLRTGKPGWPNRWMLPSWKYSLKQAQLTWSGWFPVASPLLPILALFPHVTWVRHWLPLYSEEERPLWLPLLQSLEAHRPWPLWTVLHAKLRLYLFPFFPCQTFPSLAPPAGCSPVGFLIYSQHTKWDHSPMVPLVINLVRGPVPKLLKPKSVVGTAHHRTMENCLNHHQRHRETAWVTLGVLKNTTVRTTPITVVMSQLKMNWGRTQLTLIWSQPLGIVSLVHTWRRWPTELSERGSDKGCGLL